MLGRSTLGPGSRTADPVPAEMTLNLACLRIQQTVSNVNQEVLESAEGKKDARQDAMSLHGPVLVARAHDAKADAVLPARLGSILLVHCSGSLDRLRRRRRHGCGTRGRSDVLDAGRGRWWRLRGSLLLLLHPWSWSVRSIGSGMQRS
jgi:hypothetical protein